MFFTFVRGVVRVILFVINGSAHYKDEEKLPKGQNCVLATLHRTRQELLYLAVADSPRRFNFMTKRELSKSPALHFILEHANAFPVDREEPGPGAIKTPVKILKNSDLGLIIFPSDTRHSSELRGGAALVTKVGQVPIVPSVCQGPLALKELLKHKKVMVRFGRPTDISDIKKMDKDGLAEMERRIREASDQLDKEIDPTLKYESTKKE